MLKGRLWRCLLLFLAVYAVFLIYFLHSVNNDTNETKKTTPSTQAHLKIIDSKNDQDKIMIQNVEHSLSDLEPVMTPGVLGNYEPKNIVKVSGPGEYGAGVQIQDEAERKRGEKSVADYGFNEVASEKISLDRHARDTR